MRRLGALVVVLLGAAPAVLLGGAAAVTDGAGLSLDVTGPTDVVGVPAPRYGVTATITNHDSVTAHDVSLSSTFPDGDAREKITGVTTCDGSGLNVDVCGVPDIVPGQSAVVTFRYMPTRYGTDRHHLAVSAAGLPGDDADWDVRVKVPPTSTDWNVVVTPAVGTGGLRARHEVVVTNLGPAAAVNAVFDDQLQAGEQLVSTSLGGACQLLLGGTVHCTLGTLAARRSVTVAIDTKLPPNPGDAFHVVDVGSDTPDLSDAHLFGSGPAVGGWRFWLCTACASMSFSDGYRLPTGFTVKQDETVQMVDGSVIRPDGVLARADGKLVLNDSTVTLPPSMPPGAPTAVTATPGDGRAVVSFAAPPANGSPISSYVVTASPGGYVFPGAGSPIAAVGLTNGVSYTFTVRALNGAGAGASSGASSPVTPVSVPDPPETVTAEPGNRSATVTFSPSPAPAEPVSSYTVTAFPSGKSATGTAARLTVGGLKNGVSYTFSVTATNASGTGAESRPSNAVVPEDFPRQDTEPPAPVPRVSVPEPPPPAGPRPKLPGH